MARTYIATPLWNMSKIHSSKMKRMELKDKNKAIRELLNIREGETFSDALMRNLVEKANETFSKYCELFPDLSRDELRGIWQFWYADRDEKKQDYTSDGLAKAVAAIAVREGKHTYYDVCSGSGALAIGVWNRDKECSFVCEELDEEVIPLLLFNLAVRNIPSIVNCTDVLNRGIKKSWMIDKGKKFGIVSSILFPSEEIKAEVAISNPPYNLSSNGQLLNYSFVYRALEVCDAAVFILPRGVLSSDREIKSRQDLVDNGIIKSVITIPSGFFESTSIPVCLMYLKKCNAKGVMMIDAEGITSEEFRDMRGEGSRSHTERIYHKKIRTFSEEQIACLCEMLDRETELSLFVPNNDIVAGDYSLIAGRYRKAPVDAENTMHRDYDDIIEDINRIARVRNSIKVNINKVWSEQLGMSEVADLAEQGHIITVKINKSLEMLGIEGRLTDTDFINVSNSKILEIKQQDKEILSPVIESFLPLWKQHIKTMNVMENLLLAELRDALLPALMSGRIELNKE